MLVWTRDLDTGIDWVDEQHRKIVDHINDLHVAGAADDRDRVGQVIEDLIEYTVHHFVEEEEMMERAGYRLTEVHKRVHDRFVDKVRELKTRHEANFDVCDDLLKTLGNWLFSHIRSNDNGYVPIVTETGADRRSADEELPAIVPHSSAA